jgi:dUTP pyrophosphatase
MLTGDDIRRRGVIELPDALAERLHIQPNGVDLSLDAVWRFLEAGQLGRHNADRHLPEREDLTFAADGWLRLEPGVYGIRYAERVDVPVDCGGLCFPRSSLLRMGLTVPTAVWDAGYGGQGEGLLQVSNPQGVRVQHGARIAQLVVFRLTQPTQGYAGQYQNEGRSVS